MVWNKFLLLIEPFPVGDDEADGDGSTEWVFSHAGEDGWRVGHSLADGRMQQARNKLPQVALVAAAAHGAEYFAPVIRSRRVGQLRLAPRVVPLVLAAESDRRTPHHVPILGQYSALIFIQYTERETAASQFESDLSLSFCAVIHKLMYAEFSWL